MYAHETPCVSFNHSRPRTNRRSTRGPLSHRGPAPTQAGYLSEVDSATRGVVLMQTQSVLRNAVRMLQLFEAVQQRHPFACVNVVGGGYDFAKVKPLLLSLSSELPPGEMATLRTELTAHGNGVGQLGNCLSETVYHTISIFVNPAASDLVMDAAIEDIMDKLEREPSCSRRDRLQ